MKIFNCKFYDGISSKRISACVELHQDYLKINDDFTWKYQDIFIVEDEKKLQKLIISSLENKDARLHILQKTTYDFLKNKIKFLNKKARIEFNSLFKNLIALAAFVVFIALSFPHINRLASSMISNQYLKKIGDELITKMRETGNICTSSQESRALQNFADKISGKKNLYKIYVKKDDSINAFALPGNYILLNYALIEKTQNANQLALVIALEIGHISQNHHKNLYATSILLSNFFASNSYQIISLLSFLKYSREYEKEADKYALKFAKENKIDASELINFFEILQKNQKNLPNLFKYLSTHPSNQDRISAIKNFAKNQDKNFTKIISDEDFAVIKKININCKKEEPPICKK
jgi:predicted Zn-dependent protease